MIAVILLLGLFLIFWAVDLYIPANANPKQKYNSVKSRGAEQNLHVEPTEPVRGQDREEAKP